MTTNRTASGASTPFNTHVKSPGAPRSRGPRHDVLHMQPGLTYCWCMCASCWRVDGPKTGQCICLDCPCVDATRRRA